MCHSDMDFITLESLFQKNNVEIPSYDRVEKVNSQKFFQFVMCKDCGKNKFGMSAIVSQFGDPATKSLYSDGAHRALVDAQALANVCASKQLKTRFHDRISFGQLVPDTVKKPHVYYLPS